MFRSVGWDVSATCITYHIGSAYRCTLAIATGVCVRAVVVAIAANLVATDLGVRIILTSGDVSVSRVGCFGHMYYLPYSDMDEPSRSSIVRIIPHRYNSLEGILRCHRRVFGIRLYWQYFLHATQIHHKNAQYAAWSIHGGRAYDVYPNYYLGSA